MKKKIVLISIMTMVLILSLAGCMDTSQNNNSNKNTDYGSAPWQNETEVRIPILYISTTAKFYSFDSDGTSIRYFAVIGTDGDVHVAFDACDVCYEAKKGYIQIDDVMHCINCGREFAINSIGIENTVGGCWPSYLPMKIDNNSVVIKISDLKSKSYMF